MSTERDILLLQQQLERLRKADAVYYASGTYTPVYAGSSTAGATTYTTQQGSYVRVGSIVTATGSLAWTAATGTGVATISLPFASASTTSQNFSGSVRVNNVTYTQGVPQVLIVAGDAFFTLNSPITNAASVQVTIEAAGTINFTIAYFIA